MTIIVAPPIVAQDDIVSILFTTNGTRIKVLDNDLTNPPTQTLVVNSITMDPAFGTVTLTDDKQAVIYFPPSGSHFVGEIEFEYEACIDDGLECDKANVNISVEASTMTQDDIVSALSPTIVT